MLGSRCAGGKENMKIGEIVKLNIGRIFAFCNTEDHSELDLLLDINYSKKIFNINFPFCIELEKIDENNLKKQSKRFWGEIYLVRGKRVRVTSQWYDSSTPLFIKYLKNKKIELNSKINLEINPNILNKKAQVSSRINSRYRGNAIGNAQNLLVRNILSNLGNESFSEDDWKQTKLYFSNKCAYCNEETDLLIEHAIPINKERLGEHRLGNIIPSCSKCNSLKANKDYKEYLLENTEAIKKIEEYMESRNYIPLENNEQMKKILNMAYQEVASVAERYITIINELFISE